jgi:hypothetical protein
MTNRDLYQAIGELGADHRSSDRTLEQYLSALLGLVQPYANRETLSMTEFYNLLSDAFTAASLPFQPSWQNNQNAPHNPPAYDFAHWQATVIRQIVDLHEMAAAGTLENEYRYFGIDSPRGSRWYNFVPGAFLECGMAGSLGGWEPEDDTERQFVPGPVAAMDANGNLQTMNPEDIERPLIAIPEITWEMFTDFLLNGQMYE